MAPRRIVQQAAGQTALPFAAGAPRFDAKWLIIAVCVALTLYLGVVPLAFLVWQSFFTPQSAAKAAEFTLGNYAEAYGSADTWILFGNSLKFATGAAALSFVIGTLLAWMNERTNTPFKGLFFALSVIPLIIPGILFTVAWILLGSPKIGLINLVLQRVFDTDAVFINVYSLAGMVWVDGLHYSPVAFLLMTAAFRAMDPALEESAVMSGAGVLQVASRITLPLAWPVVFATLLILFVRAIESFEVPALVGLPVGIQVFTSAIYQAVHRYPSQIGLASAYAVTLLLLTTIGVYFQSRLSSSGSKYATMTGKGFRPRPIDLGGWRYVTTAIFLVYALLIVVLPFAVLVWSSLQKFYSVPSMEALQRLTLDPYLTRFMPYGLRYNTTSMLQIHKELEESAAMSGASWATSFRRVILPLLKPGLIAGWIYIMIVSIRELSSSILLYSPGTEVLSIVIWELWENGQYVELSALGVMLILGLFVLVLLAQWVGRKFGIKDA